MLPLSPGSPTFTHWFSRTCAKTRLSPPSLTFQLPKLFRTNFYSPAVPKDTKPDTMTPRRC
jgi:hypothetical protein